MFLKKFSVPKIIHYWLKFFYVLALFYLFGFLLTRIYYDSRAQWSARATAPYETHDAGSMAKGAAFSDQGTRRLYELPADRPGGARRRTKFKAREVFDTFVANLKSRTTTAPESTTKEASSVGSLKSRPGSDGIAAKPTPPIWPDESNATDRILEQLSYVPPPLTKNSSTGRGSIGAEAGFQTGPLKVIFVQTHLRPSWADIPFGSKTFHDMACPVKTCYITDPIHAKTKVKRTYDIKMADAVLFRNSYPAADFVRSERKDQIWIFHSLESPRNMLFGREFMSEDIIWTATYRWDSDIVTPYSKYVATVPTLVKIWPDPSDKVHHIPAVYRSNGGVGNESRNGTHVTVGRAKFVKLSTNSSHGSKSGMTFPPSLDSIGLIDISTQLQGIVVKATSINYAAGKGKMVAWFVSNCQSAERLAYAKELQKYITVDIYGLCGPLDCGKDVKNDCFKMLNSHYKFYLSFENSRCRDYITEKFFENGLSNKVLPVVMGPPKSDYVRVAPHQSFIHVNDFPTPAHLAKFLHVLDQNDILYNSFLGWKETENGTFIDTKFWCRICALLHHPKRTVATRRDFNRWWNGPGVCSPS